MEYVRVQKKDHIATITLNRPQKMNAFCSEMVQEIIDAFGQIEEDRDVYCVLIDANGERAFSVGGDIQEEVQTKGEAALTFGERGKACIRAILRCRVPVICAVHGYCLGGGMEMVLAADMTVAAEDLNIGMPTIKLGTIPGWGCTKTLADVVGKARAKELLLTGRMVNAEEALDLGLVQFVVPRASLADTARELAEAIADKAPIAVMKMKECIDRGFELPLEDAFRLETEQFAICYNTEDKTEAMMAFLEKRPHAPFQYR